MPEWTEDDSATFREIAEVAVPRRREMMATILSLVPFAAGDPLPHRRARVGRRLAGRGAADDISPRDADSRSTARRRCATRRRRRAWRRSAIARAWRAFDLAALDWWDRMFGADLVVSSLCLHHLNDAKKQYLYKAVAERLSARGALLIADLVEPLHPASRRLAADEWDAQRAGAGRRARRARAVRAFRRRQVEPLSVSRPGGSPLGAVPSSRLAEARGVRGGGVLLDVRGTRRLRRLQVGWAPASGCNVSTATSGGQLIRTGT